MTALPNPSPARWIAPLNCARARRPNGRMFTRFLLSAALLHGAMRPSASAQALADWLPQLNFRPSATLQTNLMSRPAIADKGIWHFQKIEAGTGPLCTDLFAFTVLRAPQAAGREMKPSELLKWARVHLGDFLDPALATTSVSGFHDQYRWESDASAAGAVVRLNLLTADPPGPAHLAVTDQNASYFVLTGVHGSTADSRDYPVSGNRWIGWMDSKTGAAAADDSASSSKNSSPKNAGPKSAAPGRAFTLYTRAAWRVQSGTAPDKVDAIIAREEALWKGFTERLQAFITENGGQCAPASLICGQFRQDWDPIRNSNNFTPFINWMDPEGSWTSNDPKKRFQLVIHPGFTTCEFIERASGGREIRNTVPILPAAAGEGWKIERSSIDPEVLDFLDFDKKSQEQIIAAAPGPSYLTFTRKGAVLKARWNGFVVERDGKGGIAAIKAPGSIRAKEYDFSPSPAPAPAAEQPATTAPAAPGSTPAAAPSSPESPAAAAPKTVPGTPSVPPTDRVPSSNPPPAVLPVPAR